MAFMSRFSRSRSNSRSPSRRDSEKGSPVLSITELERLLYTGKTACNHADEVWPRLYIGDQWVLYSSQLSESKWLGYVLLYLTFVPLWLYNTILHNHLFFSNKKSFRDIASNRQELIKLGITHILNCAQSKWRGGAENYEGMNITYHGIEAHDSPSFDMSVNFYPAAEFIHKALSMGGKAKYWLTWQYFGYNYIINNGW